MFFLIDENLPVSLGNVFIKLGFGVESVHENASLRGEPDEVIFDYAVQKSAILVTRDLGFIQPERFPLSKLGGLILVRFPNEISTTALCTEILRLSQDLKEDDFHNLMVIVPGSIRRRKL